MDLTCIPPPPPEELDEVPLPQSAESPYSNNSNSYHNSQQPAPPDNRMEWQRAMAALNQSNPTSAPYGMGGYSPAPSLYGVPPPVWNPPPYSYPNYTSPYGQSTGLYGSGQQPSGTPYQRFASPMYASPPAPVQSSTQDYSNRTPVAQQQQQSGNSSFTGRASLVARNRQQPRPRFSPYGLGSTSVNKPALLPTPQLTDYSNSVSAPSSTEFSDTSADMQLDENPVIEPASRFVNKQAPEAGGIRFNLPNKKSFASGVKVSTPLLQRYSDQPGRQSQFPSQAGSSTNYQSSATSSGPSDGLGAVSSKDWPPSLQNYVAKAIALTPADKHEQVMHTITQMITNAYKTKTLHTVKWEDAPLPFADARSNELFGLSPESKNLNANFPNDQGNNRQTFFGRSLQGSPTKSPTKSPRVSRFSQAPAVPKSKWDTDEEHEEDFIPLTKPNILRKNKILKTGIMEKKAATAAPKKGKLMGFGAEEPKNAADIEKLRLRQMRFGDAQNTPAAKPTKAKQAKPGTLRQRGQNHSRSLSLLRTVVGTNQQIEKEYFRLTEAVEPSQVRPVHILERSLALVIEKWKKNRDYSNTESQLKSIRQDLRVQHVFTSFTVRVYETHARIALEVGDQAEFTQCLSQLEWLYETLMTLEQTRRTGKNENCGKGPVAGCENRREFLSYRLLWVMRQNRATDATRVRSRLSDDDKLDSCIAFALSVLSAYFAGDYQQFFRLYKLTPMMSSYVMDIVVPQFRQRMFVKIATAYRPTLPVKAVKDILCFASDTEMRQFLNSYKLTYTWFNKLEEIDTKTSITVIKAGPEPPSTATAARTPSASKRAPRSRFLATQ